MCCNLKFSNRRLVRNMIAGNCEPRDVRRVLATFEDGVRDGQKATIAQHPIIGQTECFSRIFDHKPKMDDRILTGRVWSTRRLHKKAVSIVVAGHRCTVFRFSPTSLFHSMRFTNDGYWLQTGGVFGRSDRTDPIFRLWTYRQRFVREINRTDRFH